MVKTYRLNLGGILGAILVGGLTVFLLWPWLSEGFGSRDARNLSKLATILFFVGGIVGNVLWSKYVRRDQSPTDRDAREEL